MVIAQKNYTEEQTNNLVTAMALTRAQIVTEQFKQKNINADTQLKRAQANYANEQAKTQSFVRSNLTSNTAVQNANLKNISVQGQILEEQRQKLIEIIISVKN